MIDPVRESVRAQLAAQMIEAGVPRDETAEIVDLALHAVDQANATFRGVIRTASAGNIADTAAQLGLQLLAARALGDCEELAARCAQGAGAMAVKASVNAQGTVQ